MLIQLLLNHVGEMQVFGFEDDEQEGVELGLDYGNDALITLIAFPGDEGKIDGLIEQLKGLKTELAKMPASAALKPARKKRGT